MNRLILTGVALAFGIGAAGAQNDVIAQRKQIMKGVGEAFFRDVGKMVKGEAPFDLAKALAAFATLESAAKKMPGLFPDTSKTGGDTHALPKVWEDKADFDKGFAALEKASANAQVETKDAVTLKAQFTQIAKICSGCHESYRAKLE